MPKLAKELGPLAVSRIATEGLHFVGGVQGLALHVTNTGARSWVLRVMVAGKRREMGLGNYPGVPLADAREAARKARALIREGVDPIERAKAARSALAAAVASALTFKECAEEYVTSHEAGWKSAKHAKQWRATLEAYAYPKMGSLLVRDVGLPHVLAVLDPIWRTKTETASRVRGRIESVLDWAKGRGYRSGDNPAAWKGNLKAQLPKPEKVAKAEHHPALPAHDVGAFMAELRQVEGLGAKALEFVILTAARSGEVRLAEWSEIDEDAKIWTVPAARMKAGAEHRVPLSDAAMSLLKAQPRIAGTPLIFPGRKLGPLSDMTLTAVIRRLNAATEPARWKDARTGEEVVPHGFRSTFRDWASERTNYPRDVAEMALAHTIGDKVEAAYRRGDLFDKRRRMMAEWAEFCARVETKGNVVALNRQLTG